MWWLLGVGVVVAIGVATLEFWSVRQVEERLRRKWRDHDKSKNQAEGLVQEREEERLSNTDANCKKVD